MPADGKQDAPTWQIRVVPNRYPAFELPDGAHEVIIESPEHTTHFTDLDPKQSSLVMQMWARRVAYWRNESSKEYLLLFKNEGLAAGASLEHIHSQFTAMNFMPNDLQAMWNKLSQDPKANQPKEEQIIAGSSLFQAVTPIAPRAAFETWIMPMASFNTPFEALSENDAAADELSDLLQTFLKLIRSAARTDSYNLVLQIAPNPVASQLGHCWWIEIAPRSASLAGFELATNWRINAVSPELATETLRKNYLQSAANQSALRGSDSEVFTGQIRSVTEA